MTKAEFAELIDAQNNVNYWITDYHPPNLEKIIFSKNGVCGIGQYIQLGEKGFIIPNDKSPRIPFKGLKWFPMPKDESNKEKAVRIGAPFHKDLMQ